MGHFLTTQPDEVTAAIQKGRVFLGIACYVIAPAFPDPVAIPFHRLYRADTDDYLYTTSQVEADNAAQHDGYVYQTIACSVYDPNKPIFAVAVPLSRFYNPQTGEHFYTALASVEYITPNIQTWREQAGFQLEGTAGFVFEAHHAVVPDWYHLVPLYRLSRIGATPPKPKPWWGGDFM